MFLSIKSVSCAILAAVFATTAFANTSSISVPIQVKLQNVSCSSQTAIILESPRSSFENFAFGSMASSDQGLGVDSKNQHVNIRAPGCASNGNQSYQVSELVIVPVRTPYLQANVMMPEGAEMLISVDGGPPQRVQETGPVTIPLPH